MKLQYQELSIKASALGLSGIHTADLNSGGSHQSNSNGQWRGHNDTSLVGWATLTSWTAEVQNQRTASFASFVRCSLLGCDKQVSAGGSLTIATTPSLRGSAKWMVGGA